MEEKTAFGVCETVVSEREQYKEPELSPEGCGLKVRDFQRLIW